MLLSLIAYWLVGLPLGYTLAMTDILEPSMGAKGFWIGLIVGLTCAALLLGSRLWWISRHYWRYGIKN
jgi:MATE family multidrug resistance protein